MKKLLVSFFTIAWMLPSCAPRVYYQIHKTVFENIKEADGVMMYEDENCIITYNLWSNGGKIVFPIYNKTDENIYLRTDECFFIKNGVAYDYDETKKELIVIPPKATKAIYQYDVSNDRYKHCDLMDCPKERQIKPMMFNSDNSPYSIRNRITYTVGASDEFVVVENKFYVSEITNYPEREITEIVLAYNCGKVDESGKKKLIGQAPSKFYIRYQPDWVKRVPKSEFFY